MRFVVIMAGGTGKRLWPLSRQDRPKQVIKFFEGKTLLRRCFNRLANVVDSRNILVLTNAGYSDMVRQDLPELPYDNVIAEPDVRDTAGAIGLAASVISRFDPDATMAVVTADQVISPSDVFAQAISDAFCYVEKNPKALVTFGIEPTSPSTDLGYIKFGDGDKCPNCENIVHKVETFKEKPDIKTAKQYLKDGSYYWNSGLFVWKAKRILELIFKNIPQAKKPLLKIQAAWDSAMQEATLVEYFPKLPKISIDFAVMEKADNVHAIKLGCKWFDLGSFSALANMIKSDANGNIVIAGQSQLLNCKDSVIATEDSGHLIAAIGLDKVVVVHTPDATLVCSMDEAQKLKELLESMKDTDKEKYL